MGRLVSCTATSQNLGLHTVRKQQSSHFSGAAASTALLWACGRQECRLWSPVTVTLGKSLNSSASLSSRLRDGDTGTYSQVLDEC